MKKNLQNVVNFISSTILVTLFLCLVGCLNGEIDDYTDASINYVTFSPEQVKSGDELTINFEINNNEKHKLLSDVTIDNGNIVCNRNTKYIDNSFVNFYVDVTNDNIIQLDGSKGKIIQCGKFQLRNICPITYLSISDNQVKCIVPDNAKTGYLKLSAVYSAKSRGLSSKQLIILDEDK